MNIAFTCNNLNNGGAERVICNLANRMVEDGHSVRIICYSVTSSFYYELKKGVSIVQIDPEISKRKKFLARKVAGVINFIKLVKALEWADKVVSFYTRQNCYSIIACQILGKPIICAERDHFFMSDGRVNHVLRNKCYPKATGFIHQTSMVREWLRDKEGVKCSDIILPNPLWMNNFVEYSPKKGYISAVGRLEEQKNYKEMIDAFGMIYEKVSYASLHIYGEGPLKEELQKYINDKNLSNIVILEGISKNISEVYAQSEVFVMFSHGEGYPNALMEALASGVPCVSSNCPVGGPADMINDGENGFLVPCSDIDKFANKVVELLQNVELRKKFSSNAVNIRETNDFEKIYNTFMKYVNSVTL